MAIFHCIDGEALTNAYKCYMTGEGFSKSNEWYDEMLQRLLSGFCNIHCAQDPVIHLVEYSKLCVHARYLLGPVDCIFLYDDTYVYDRTGWEQLIELFVDRIKNDPTYFYFFNLPPELGRFEDKGWYETWQKFPSDIREKYEPIFAM